MKANEAPEKLYFGESDKGLLDIYSGRELDDEIEYTRTDAFIEKACEWLRGNYLKYPSEDCADAIKFVADFTKYMKR